MITKKQLFERRLITVGAKTLSVGLDIHGERAEVRNIDAGWRIQFSSPHDLDNFINRLIETRNQAWPWPPFQTQ